MSAKRDVGVYLDDILEYVNRIQVSIKGLTEKRFARSVDKQDAIVRRLEVIGEATKRIPATFRNKHKQVRWSDIAKTRDKIIHHYEQIDLKVIWSIVKEDLPLLKKQVKKLLREYDRDSSKK